METEQRLIPIKDLFGIDRLTDGKSIFSERATLVQFFADEMERAPKQIGVRLGHYKNLSDLYALKSQYLDRMRRPCFSCLQAGKTAPCEHSRDTARRYFWWATKTIAI